VKKVYEIDGNSFDDLEGFLDVIGRILIPGCYWGRNLNAFNDILRGGFGTPEEGFVLRWRNSDVSREKLGFPETLKSLNRQLLNCHPSSLLTVQREISDAQLGLGKTLFDTIIDIIRDHGVRGEQSSDGVELELL
jgi:RNAse (barnase) inhibitor barstar